MIKIDGINSEILESLYLGNGYTQRQIANIFDCSRKPVRNRMKEYGIPRRSSGWKLTDFTFDDKQKEIFEGCMLGDGGLEWHTNHCYFNNTDIHKEYLLWLQKQLGVEDISSVKPSVYKDGSPYAYMLRTRVIPSIREQYNIWYPYKTRHGTNQNRHYKIFPKDIELTLPKVLFWYLGDGTYSKRDKVAYFTSCLYLDDWALLLDKIGDLLDVSNGISIFKSRKDKMGIQRYALRLNKGVTGKFFNMIDDLGFDIPECYQYKFGKVKLCQ